MVISFSLVLTSGLVPPTVSFSAVLASAPSATPPSLPLASTTGGVSVFGSAFGASAFGFGASATSLVEG